MTERVTCRIDAGVADVRLNRPEKMNALDAAADCKSPSVPTSASSRQMHSCP